MCYEYWKISHGDLDLELKNLYTKLYEMYSNFRISYYQLKNNEPVLNSIDFAAKD